MLGSIIRNYKNAGVRVEVSLYVQRSPGDKEFQALFAHRATGLEIHNLASAAHRELLRQARASAIPRSPGELFEDIAWKVAAYSLVEAMPKLKNTAAVQVGMVVPYTCFIAEYLSKTYRESEGRDVCISTEGVVFINSFAGFHNDSKTLGNYKH